MFEQTFIEKLASELKMAPENIVREGYEIITLKAISESSLSKNLVFKGGTALRLVYNSPRFSEDLDFSLTGPINFSDFKKNILDLCSRYKKEMELSDISDKKQTFFSVLKIKEDFLPQKFSVKIEISKRKFSPSQKPGFKLLPLKSSVLPITVFLNVATLETIMENKLQAVKERVKPRDLFDLWFVSNILKKPVDVKIKGFGQMNIRQELNRYLPKNYHHITEHLINSYANNSGSKRT